MEFTDVKINAQFFVFAIPILQGSYSPKSLHKFILPENLSTSNFREVEIKEICSKVVYQVILAIMGPYDPLKSPLHDQQSTLQGSYSPKILHSIVLPVNGFISIFFEVKMFEKCPKCHISCNFGQFWGHMTHSKTPYTNKKVHCRTFLLV